MKQTKNTAFTLVELIVVITILAVLATVAFISFQGYSQQARDSVRLADMQNITKAFEFIKTKDQQLPIPDKKIDITASGTIFQYQGVLELTTLEKSGVHNGGIDPLTLDPYGYAVNFARNKFQLIGFLENSESVANTMFAQSFADNSDKYIKTSGDSLGILLDNSTKEIITQSGALQDIDIESVTTQYSVILDDNIIISDNDRLTGLKSTSLNNGESSCLELLSNNTDLLNKDDYYMLQTANGLDSVYCDMTRDGGGWTLYTAKNNFHFSNTGLFSVSENILDSIDYDKIRYDYKSPSGVIFPLIYTPYNQQEGDSILSTPNRVAKTTWENIQHYQNSTDFANAFVIGEGNSSTISLQNFRNAIVESGHTKIRGWIDVNGAYVHVMGTAFAYSTPMLSYLWFPAAPYIGTYRVGDETFQHKDIDQEWDDGRSITIWIK